MRRHQGSFSSARELVGPVAEGQGHDLEIPLPEVHVREAAAGQHRAQRFAGEARLVGIKVVSAALDLHAVAVNRIAHRDRPGRRLVQDVVDVHGFFHHRAHHLPEIGYAQVGETAVLEHVKESGQHLGHIVAVVVLEIVRAVHRVVLGPGEFGHLARIAQHIGLAAGIDVQEHLFPAVEMSR